MTRLSLSLFGSFQAEIDGEPVTGFRSDKVRALLAYLAVEAGRSHRRETLSALFWPAWPDTGALRNLRKSIHRLRRPLDRHVPGLSDHLLTVTRQAIELHAHALSLDVDIFHDLLAQVEAHPHRHLHLCQACLARLARAVDLYQGDLLAGLAVDDAPAFEEWLLVTQEGLHTRVLAALQALAEAHLQRGDSGPANRYAARQLALEPWHETAHRQLMRALLLDGRRNEALAQYESCRRILHEELDVEPDPETSSLYRQAARGDSPTAIGGPPAPALHHLPAHFTPFVGRQAELAHIAECLVDPDCRLLSLVGPGGIGKTRLAIQAIQQPATARFGFHDGIFFVPLETLSTPALLPSVLARSLGLAVQQDTPDRDQLLDHLRDRHLLFVLDNLEHLLGDGAVHELLLALLANAPAIKILATSRHPLDLQAEWLLRLKGLRYPDRDCRPPGGARACDECPYGAVQLFLHSAARAQVGFSPTPDQCAAAVRICRRLHGVPLAIELAAARMRTHNLETIEAEIERSPDSLATPLRDVPPRHRSLRALFDHSWALLTPEEQFVLARASLFVKAFDVEAATAMLREEDAAADEGVWVRPAVARVLSSLAAKSLLERTDEGHYAIHEVMHQFVAEKRLSLAQASEAATPARDPG